MIIAIYWTIILTSNSLAYMYIAMKSRSDSDNLSHDTWKGFKLLLILLVRPKGLYIKFLVRIWCIVPAECNETCVHIGTLLQAVTTGLLLFFLCHSWLFIDQSSNQLQAAGHYSPVVLWCAHRWKTDDCVCVCVCVCLCVTCTICLKELFDYIYYYLCVSSLWVLIGLFQWWGFLFRSAQQGGSSHFLAATKHHAGQVLERDWWWAQRLVNLKC